MEFGVQAIRGICHPTGKFLPCLSKIYAVHTVIYIYNKLKVIVVLLTVQLYIQVVNLVTEGYRLVPPPGCPRAIYKIMMDCW